jgi:hypothetical protein
MSTTVRAVANISVPATTDREMTADLSLRHAALVGGLGLLLMAVLAPIANFGILQGLIVPGDAQATAQHIAAAQGLFRLAIGSFFVVAMLDVVVAWALYVWFKPLDRSLSLLAALFRVVYATMLAVALNSLVTALQFVGGADSLNTLGTTQLQTQMMVSVGAFQSGWDLALIVFGLHLVVLGVLVFRSGNGNALRVLGVLVVAAGLGYLVDGCGKLLLRDYSLTVAVFTFVGEPLLMCVLLWQGIRGLTPPPARAG